jgi:hypothetical protein
MKTLRLKTTLIAGLLFLNVGYATTKKPRKRAPKKGNH